MTETLEQPKLKTFLLSDDQQQVVDSVMDWLQGDINEQNQALTIGGYAGTGKTCIIAHMLKELSGVAVCALCGKAAHVLRQKGVPATTIHSLIYAPYKDERGKIKFRKREFLEGVELIVVDEASMVNFELLRDLLSFELPVLFVGDHGQLEPIGENPNLMKNPALRLEKIHRQALDNPILRLATAFREGREPEDYGDDPRCQVKGRYEFEKLISPEWQIICGYNKTRHSVNSRIRKQLGFTKLVEVGDKLIVLRNNKTYGVFNGQQVTVTKVGRDIGSIVWLTVENDAGEELEELPCVKEQFGNELMKDHRSMDTILADYGACITAHKSQGSEYGQVLVLDEVSPSWDARRWRYTSVTRARERLIYCM